MSQTLVQASLLPPRIVSTGRQEYAFHRRNRTQSRGYHVFSKPSIKGRQRLSCQCEEIPKNISKPDNDNNVEQHPDEANEDETISPNDVPTSPERASNLLPGIEITPIWKKKEPSTRISIPAADIETLRNQVFGFDSFFVTGQEQYEGGVLFKGNLRGDSAQAFQKLTEKLKAKFSNQYQLFLLNDRDEGKPVAVILPSESIQPAPSALPNWLIASAFGLTTVISLFLRSSGFVDLDSLPSLDNIISSVPNVLVFVAVLAAHEVGHLAAAKRAGLSLGPPFFIPSLQLGSFGAITPIRGIVKSRQQLAEVAVAGPLAGAAVALSLLIIGLLLPPGEQGVVVQSTAFHDSILVGGIAKLFYGSALTEGSSLTLNPLALDAWAALLINSINCIPAGELDGGRLASALWGRQAAASLSLASIVLLGFSALLSDVALYWVVLILFLQRGPVTPQANEVSPLPDSLAWISAGVLTVSLLAYSPLLIPLS